MRGLQLSGTSLSGLLLLTMILICPQSTLAQDCETEKRLVVSGKKLVEMLELQQQVLLDCVQVKGEIDLRGLGTTRGPFVLTNSIIDGALIAPSTILKARSTLRAAPFLGRLISLAFLTSVGLSLRGMCSGHELSLGRSLRTSRALTLQVPDFAASLIFEAPSLMYLHNFKMRPLKEELPFSKLSFATPLISLAWSLTIAHHLFTVNSRN
jgi:hypothetical protein